MSFLDAAFAPRPAPARAPFTPPADIPAGYGPAALADECREVANAAEGGRNHRLNVAAVKIAGIVAGGYLDADVARDALHAAGAAAGLDHGEIAATVNSGFRYGLTVPRIKPDLPDTETKVNEWLTSSGLSTSPSPSSSGTSSAPTETTHSGPHDLDDKVREHLPIINWADLWADDSREEWIIEPILPARRLVALYSAPKVGKSLLMLELAVAIAQGKRVLGYDIDRPRRVLYVDFENDPLGDVRARLINMAVTPDDLDNLCYLSYPSMARLDTADGGDQLMAAVHTYACEVVVIDTVSRAIGGDENENDTWLDFYRETGLKLKQAGVAMIRLDHSGKDETKGQRGGSAKEGDVDAVWRLSKRTDDTFELINTHARFPIANGDRVLTLTRVDHPLHHKVDPYGAKSAVVDAIVTLLDELDTPLGDGFRKVGPIITAAGIKASRATTLDAIERRRRLRGHVELNPDDDG